MKLNKGGARTAGSRAVPAFRGRRLGTLCAGDAAPCWPRAWAPRGRGRDSGNLGVTRRPWTGLSSRRHSSPRPRGEAAGLQGRRGKAGARSTGHRSPLTTAATRRHCWLPPPLPAPTCRQLHMFYKKKREGQLWCKWLWHPSSPALCFLQKDPHQHQPAPSHEPVKLGSFNRWVPTVVLSRGFQRYPDPCEHYLTGQRGWAGVMSEGC